MVKATTQQLNTVVAMQYLVARKSTNFDFRLSILFMIDGNDLTCAVKAITGVSSITGTDEAVRYVSTSCKLTAASIVRSAFVHVCVSRHKVLYDNNGKSTVLPLQFSCGLTTV